MLLRSKARLKSISSPQKATETSPNDDSSISSISSKSWPSPKPKIAGLTNSDADISAGESSAFTRLATESLNSESSSDSSQNKSTSGDSAGETIAQGEAGKIIGKMTKNDLEGLVVRLCGEVKRLQKVLRH